MFGGTAPLIWKVAAPAELPDGLALDSASGTITGKPKAAVAPMTLRLKVTDAAGRSDARAWAVNPPGVAGPAASTDRRAPRAKKNEANPMVAKGRPEPPGNVMAVAGNGCVTLSWKPSASPGVVAYRVKRSTAPAARQEERVYVTKETPPLERFDYIVVQRRFGNFDMRYVNSRVRGIGNPMNQPDWYWTANSDKVIVRPGAAPTSRCPPRWWTPARPACK